MSKKSVLIVVLLVIGVAVAVIAVRRFVISQLWPDGLIQVNGRIEGDHITIAGKFPGRVQELSAREGDTVKAGQVLLRLDDSQTRARVVQARSGFEAFEAQVQATHTSLAVLNLEVPLAIEVADAGVDSARAALERAQAVEYEARRDAERIRPLAAENATSQQQLDQAEARWSVAKSEIAVAKSALARARKELAQAELGKKRIHAKEDEVAALERQRDQAEAGLTEAQTILDDLTIVAPAAGTITTRMVDIGEVVAAGAPLFELVDLDNLYLKVYVPEVQIGKIRLNLPARVHVDAFPDRSFEATVRYIASKAEFTPKEVQSPDERVKLIFAVKLYLTENPDHQLSPGLPADAIIRWKENVVWMKPR